MRVEIDGNRYYPAPADRFMLSVLIPSVSTRRATFAPRIADQLFGQHEALPPDDAARIEILMLTDAKGMVLGDKRNAMVRMASGKYVVFVDDDDRVEPDYLQTLLRQCEYDVDCVCLEASVSLDGGEPMRCRYSIKYPTDQNTVREYRRLPNHLCAVRRSIALQAPFPSRLCGEDSEYAKLLQPLLKTERQVGRILYHYDFNSATTETQGGPTVDVVMLSKATDSRMRAMTQNAINTCIAGAAPAKVRIVVIEQESGVEYQDAITVHDPSPFNYNAFCNNGARHGSAEWIVFANNDLHFNRGWLKELLAANHPVVSPIDPNRQSQRNIRQNMVGTENGRHFSGWCFMLRRDIWEQIGGLDEDFGFWCADDATIEQLIAIGISPMVVARSSVLHLASVTVGDIRKDDGSRTWAMVHRFEQKYGKRKFVGDRRYEAWKVANA